MNQPVFSSSSSSSSCLHRFLLLFICWLCIIPLMVSPLSLMLNVASNCFHPCDTALLFSNIHSVNTYIFRRDRQQTVSNRSIPVTRRLHGSGRRFESKTNKKTPTCRWCVCDRKNSLISAPFRFNKANVCTFDELSVFVCL